MTKFSLPLLASALGFAASVTAKTSCVPKQVNLFSFGSSWTDYSFDVKGRQPEKNFPLGNPEFGDTKNSQGGANYIQYLTTKLNHTLTFSYDLAKGGACVDNKILKCAQEADLTKQITETFDKTYGPGQGKFWGCEDSIFLVWMGDNDVLVGSKDKEKAKNPDALTKSLMDKYFSLVDDLMTHGAKKFFFVTVPAQDRSPKVLGSSKDEQMAYLKQKWSFNSALESRINDFKKKHDQIKAELFNSTAFMDPILNEPKKYGFDDATCIDSLGPNPCIWHNDFHLNSKMHELMAKAMVPQLDKVGFEGVKEIKKQRRSVVF